MIPEIKDIKPFIEIQEHSLWILAATVIAGLIIGYKAYKAVYSYVLDNCKIECPKYYLYKLRNIDWSNPKKAAYDATKYGKLLAKDKRRVEIFNQLRTRLDRYKYKTEVEDIDKETLNYFSLYLQVCDESL